MDQSEISSTLIWIVCSMSCFVISWTRYSYLLGVFKVTTKFSCLFFQQSAFQIFQILWIQIMFPSRSKNHCQILILRLKSKIFKSNQDWLIFMVVFFSEFGAFFIWKPVNFDFYVVKYLNNLDLQDICRNSKILRFLRFSNSCLNQTFLSL